MPTELLIGASVFGLAGTALAASAWINWLAKKDVFFTELPEGSAKAIMRNDTFDHFIMSYAGWHLNDPHASFFDKDFPAWEVLENKPDVNYHTQNAFTHWSGVNFMGLNPYVRILKYRFKWNEEAERDDGKSRVWKRDEMTDFIFARDFPYIVILDGAETCEGVPIDLQYQLVIRITNPYKALFGVSDWLKLATAAANRCVRSYVGSRTFKQLQSETDPDDANDATAQKDADKFSCPIVLLTNELPDDSEELVAKNLGGLSGRYGITIVTANPQTVELVGENKKEYQQATTNKFLAETRATATRIQADADAYQEETVGRAKANVIEMKGAAEGKSLQARLNVLKDAGELGALMLQADAMEANGEGKTVIWANNPFISNRYPGLASTLDELGITPEILKAAIENLTKGKAA